MIMKKKLRGFNGCFLGFLYRNNDNKTGQSMGKIRRILIKLQNNRKYQIVFFVVCMSVVLGMYAGLQAKIAREKSQEYTVVEDKKLIKYVEEVNVEENVLKISGWCFYSGIESENQEIQIFLRNLEDEKDTVWLTVERSRRDDINDYYACEYDYSQIGFEAKTKAKKLDLQEKNYEIFLKLEFEKDVQKDTESGEKIDRVKYNKTISTGNYIVNGELTALHPRLDRGPLRAEAAELNTIFDEGTLLVYREGYDMYVYQYGKNIYWVAGENFSFDENGKTYIQYQIDTSQIDKLPAKRLEMGRTWDSRGFNFEEYEITGDGFAPYRVSVREIPTTYPVLCFWTGYYANDAWIWRENLNLDIRELIK